MVIKLIQFLVKRLLLDQVDQVRVGGVKGSWQGAEAAPALGSSDAFQRILAAAALERVANQLNEGQVIVFNFRKGVDDFEHGRAPGDPDILAGLHVALDLFSGEADDLFTVLVLGLQLL